MWRLYVLPITGSGTSRHDPRRPKYLAQTPELAGLAWAMMDYGALPWCLLAADVADSQHAWLDAQADVRSIPLALDAAVGTVAARNAVRSSLEAARIPAGWVTTATTWREIVRAVGGLMQFAQRYNALAAETPGQERQLVLAPAELDLRMNQLTAVTRQTLAAAAASLGYDTSTISGTTTLRQALKQLADQWGDRPFFLGGMVI